MPQARLRRRVAAAGVLLTAGCLALPALQAHADPSGAKTQRLSGSLSPRIAKAKPTGSVAGTSTSTVQLWLKPDAAAAGYARSVSTPGSPSFHHFLSPKQYTDRFGADAATVHKVRSWLKNQGFTKITTDSQRNYISAEGSVSTTQKAFSVQIKRYRLAGADGKTQTVRSNDRAVRLPTSIASQITGVTGLDNVQPQTYHTVADPKAAAAADTTCSSYYGEKMKSGLPAYKGSTSFPYAGCGYNAKQLRAAYGMNDTNDGSGQTIAYVEVGKPYKMLDALTQFAKNGDLPAPKSANYKEVSIGQPNACGNPFDGEEQLDVEAGYAMAPGATHLLVAGDGCNSKDQGLQALFDADNKVINGDGNAPLATIASNSWGLALSDAPSDFASVMADILTRAAAEGVGMYFSSGDNPGVSLPAADPNAIAVGGTSLGLDADNKRIFETGWSNEMLEVGSSGYTNDGIGRSAAGGGTYPDADQPDYQKGVVPTSVSTPSGGDGKAHRAVPDISAVADAYTGIQQVDIVQGSSGDTVDTFADGGTSLAAPLVAGMIATVQQGGTQLGFADPLLYKLAGTDALHDTTPVTDSTPAAQQAVFCPQSNGICGTDSLQTMDSEDAQYTDQSTAKGYDTMTGIGTPNGQTFIQALRSAAGSSQVADSAHQH